MRHQIRRLVSGFLFIFILLVTVLMSPFDGQTVEGNDEKGTWSYWENQILLQKPAANAYNELMEYFEVEYGYEGDDIKYPQDFGGAYIDEQNKLVIQLKDYSNQASYQSIFTYTDDVEFQKVQYSYNELALYSSKVAASFSNEADITGYGIDVINNQISVNVTQPNDVQLIANRAEKLLSTDYNSEISFSYDPAPELTSELWGGDAIRNLNTASYTMAIGGYWNGNPAILTAGHANSQYNRIYYSPTESMIGTVVLQHFVNGSMGDYSIVQLTNNNNVITNKVLVNLSDYSYKRIVGTHNGAVGQLLCKYGTNGGFAIGRVVDTSYTADYSGTVISGLVRTSLTQGSIQLGDSGGPWWINYESSYFCGVQSGRQGEFIALYTPIHRIIERTSGNFQIKTN